MKTENIGEKARQTWLFNEKGKFLVMENEKKGTKKLFNPFVWLFKKNPRYALAFLLPSGILFLVYLIFGVYPVSNRSVLSLDLNGQYVYYFDYIYDVLAGKESIFYSWSRNLSGEFLGIVGYYLASPFNLLVWIFPREYITEGLLTMILAKVGAIGVCTAVYLSRGRKLSGGTTVIFSMLYALCSYTIVQTMNPMWLDGVMALPLVIYGVESLVRHGRFRLLIGSLIYSFVTCFYIGYMIGIFTAFYFVYYFIVSRSTENIDGGAFLARIGVCFVSAVTAILCSCFMLIPVYNSLSLGKLTFSEPDYSARTSFGMLETLQKLLPNSYDTVRMDGLPFIYCGIITVILIPCYFYGTQNNSILRRKRIAGAIFALVIGICMYVTPVDMLWHGGQMPNWLPYRYSFILTFLLIAWGAEAFERLSDISTKVIGGSALGFFALMVYLESTDTFNPDLGNEGRELLDGITVVLPAMLILIIFAAFLINRPKKSNRNRVFMITICMLVGCELFYNTLTSVVKQDVDIVYSSRDSYIDYIVPVRDKVEEIKSADEGFYRIEKNFFRTVNDPLALNMYGLSHSSSTLNEKPIATLGDLGVTSRSHYTRYSGATPVIDDLFGVKYILSTENNYDTKTIKTADDISVEINDDAMPMAYLVDSSLGYLDFENYPGDADNVFKRQNRLLSIMTGETETADFIRLMDPSFVIKETENLKEGIATGGHKSFKVEEEGKNAQIKYTLNAEVDGEIFMWLPTDYERKVNVWVNRTINGSLENEWAGNYFETDNYCVKSLGVFKRNETFSVTLTLTKDDVYFKDAYFGYVDENVYLPALQKLHDMNMDTIVTKKSPTHIVIDYGSDAERLLFTTIPAEPGWEVYLDGKKMNYTELLGSLIGLSVPEGYHTVELKFTPAGYPVALYLTGGGILLFVLLCVLYTRIKKESGSLSGASAYEKAEAYFEQVTEDLEEDEDGQLYLGGEESIRSIISDFNEINNTAEQLSLIDDFAQEEPESGEQNETNENEQEVVDNFDSEMQTSYNYGEHEQVTEAYAEEAQVESYQNTQALEAQAPESYENTQASGIYQEPQADYVNTPPDYNYTNDMQTGQLNYGGDINRENFSLTGQYNSINMVEEEIQPTVFDQTADIQQTDYVNSPVYDYPENAAPIEYSYGENDEYGFAKPQQTPPLQDFNANQSIGAQNGYFFEENQYGYAENAPVNQYGYDYANPVTRDYNQGQPVTPVYDYSRGGNDYGDLKFIAEEQEELVESFEDFVPGPQAEQIEQLIRSSYPNQKQIFNSAESAQELFPEDEIFRQTIINSNKKAGNKNIDNNNDADKSSL